MYLFLVKNILQTRKKIFEHWKMHTFKSNLQQSLQELISGFLLNLKT